MEGVAHGRNNGRPCQFLHEAAKIRVYRAFDVGCSHISVLDMLLRELLGHVPHSRRFTQLWSDSLLKVCRSGGGSTVELKHPKMLCPNTSTCNPGHIFKINRSWRPRRLSSCNMHSQRISRQPHAHDLGRDLRERTCKRCPAPTIKQESMERGKHTNICKKMKNK